MVNINIYILIRLFQDLTINNLSLLTVNLDRLIPSPHIVDELSVLLTSWVQLSVAVGLPVWSNVKGRLELLTSNHDGTDDTVVVVLTVDDETTEHVPDGGRQSVEEPTDQVVRHESQSQLIVVFVLDLP